MELSTIEMTREEAEAALAEWGETIKAKRVAEEDAAIAAGYEALAKGQKLIALTPTIQAGGQDELGRPRLAVAPTAADIIYLNREREGTVHFSVTDSPQGWDWRRVLVPLTRRVTVLNVLPSYRWDQAPEGSHMGSFGWRAMVPVVPPRFRHRGWRSCHVLFEAEWARHSPPPPGDPALIKHLRGDLWVVKGVWDLTPLERAVLLERNR